MILQTYKVKEKKFKEFLIIRNNKNIIYLH